MKIRLLTLFLLAVASSLAWSQTIKLEDQWHQWRGPDNNGASLTANPPLEWGEEKNLGWKVAVPGHGISSPVVWGDKVFLTTAVNTGQVDPSKPRPEDQPERVFGIKHPNTAYDMVVLCYDRQNGKLLWRDVARTLVPHEGHHRDASFASSSPFCDGERVYFWFGSAGVFAYRLDGKKVWERELDPAKVGAHLGEGSSPVIHQGKLVLVRDHAGPSTIEVLDASSGKTIWKRDRDENNAWATPAVVERNGVTQVITSASGAVRSYNLENGDLIWQASGLSNNCAPCPIVRGDTVYCMSGYKGHALLAIPIDGKGDVTSQIRWSHDKATPYVPSALLYGEQLYFTQSNQGILSSFRAEDGHKFYERERVPELGDLYASPVGAKGRVYLAGRRGVTAVIEQGPDFKVLATSKLDDSFHASPALAGNQLFLRGLRFLYCLEEGGQASGKAVAAANPERETPPAAPAGENDPTRQLLEKIAKRPIPKDYPGGGPGHQPYVDKIIQALPPRSQGQLGQLWRDQKRLFPEMKNRGSSFIRILDYVRSEAKAGAE